MMKLGGMSERMGRAWTEGFNAMPPLFWLPYFLVLLIWSVAWLGFCITGWLVGFYCCKECKKVMHRSRKRANQLYDRDGAWAGKACSDCY